MPKSRKCYACKQTKLLEEFRRSKNKPLGYDYQCKSCYAKERNISNKKNPERTLFNHVKCRAKKLGKEFSISISDITIPKVCPVLGIPIITNGNKMSDNSPTLDRIDNNKGYVVDNVLVVSNKANRIKNNATPKEIVRVGLFYEFLLRKLCEKESSL